MKLWLAIGPCCIAAAFALLGCGDDPSRGLVPVSGSVTLDNKPLSGALVTLVPQGETLGQGSFGHTDAAGKFVLQTPEGQKGAVAGTYKVLINKQVNPDGTDFVPTEDVSPMDSNAREILLPRYSDFERSSLKATIPAEGTTLKFDLVAKSK